MRFAGYRERINGVHCQDSLASVVSRAPQARSLHPTGNARDLAGPSPSTQKLLTRDTNFFTFFLRVKSVLVASAAAVPEPGTALGLGVIVPFQLKVPAGPLVFL